MALRHIIWICVSINFLTIECLNIPSKQNLHHFMDQNELDYYFGANSINSSPEYEIIDLPVVADTNQQKNTETVSFVAFNRSIDLNLRPNNVLVSPHMRVVRRIGLEAEDLPVDVNSPSCHFLHANSEITASINNCNPDELSGLIFMGDQTFEIQPLTERLKYLLGVREPLTEENDQNGVFKVPHIIKRSTNNNLNFENDFIRQNVVDDNFNENFVVEDFSENHGMFKRQAQTYPMVELAVFFDEAAYKIFAPYYNHNEAKIRDMILSYINGVQALFHHHSLGNKIDVTIVYLELMRKQSYNMNHAYGERGDLLDNFCAYQKSLNPGDDTNPKHWDMAVYISGLDFFAWENGNKNRVTMGLATVGGVCISEYNCLIAEFGTVNAFGKPYPSAGFNSVYILAHEMGHNLGMHHDSTTNSCPKDGYIMSPSRGTQGETVWSTCSANIARNLHWAKCLYDKPGATPEDLNAWKYSGFPGVTYTSKMQCELLLTDKDARIQTSGQLNTICQNLHCRTPNRSGFYFAGPALQGTDCGKNLWCEGGECVKKRKIEIIVPPKPGGWSSWKATKCKTECLQNSKGYQNQRRECNNPSPVNTDEGCEGPPKIVALCDDKKFCKSRIDVFQYATQKCQEFSTKLPDLDDNAQGLQAPHEDTRMWMGCSIFCRRKGSGSFYTPRVELNDMGVNPYFPDGTWCHKEGNENFYCVQHHCLPESTKISKTGLWRFEDEIPGNALLKPMNEDWIRYFSIYKNGTSLLSDLTSKHFDQFNDDEQWTNVDYLELPKDKNFRNHVK